MYVLRTLICFLPALMLAGCNAGEQPKETTDQPVVEERSAEKPSTEEEEKEKVEEVEEVEEVEKPDPPSPKVYSNERFKNVTAEKTGNTKFLVKGKAQVFEATFNWVVEDGHEELKKGYEMTDAGAPEWGNFSFTIDVAKKRANSTLHLILFESSPKDGSRQYELPVRLY